MYRKIRTFLCCRAQKWIFTLVHCMRIMWKWEYYVISPVIDLFKSTWEWCIFLWNSVCLFNAMRVDTFVSQKQSGFFFLKLNVRVTRLYKSSCIFYSKFIIYDCSKWNALLGCPRTIYNLMIFIRKRNPYNRFSEIFKKKTF